MTSHERISNRDSASHRSGASGQTAAHGHPFESEDLRGRWQSPGAAALTPNAVLQLQRTYGNRFVQQLLRDRSPVAPPIRPHSVSALSRRLIQRDRLVEMQGQQDEKDFNAARTQVEKGLSVKSSGDWMKNSARFDVGQTEDLFIWGHMTPENIGGWDFYELAELMVERGFRGCKSIRLIGCNDAGNYGQAPQSLYVELGKQFKEQEVEDYILTPIHATKGPLHSGVGKNVFALEDWFVENTEEIEEELNDKLMAVQNYIDGGEQNQPADFQGRFFENKFDSFLSFAKMSSKLYVGGEIPPSSEQDDYDYLKDLFQAMMDYFEKYVLKGEQAKHLPALKRPVEGSETGAKEWNPAAWTSYSG